MKGGRINISGFGMVALLVVLVVVLLLTARSWTAVAPTALEVRYAPNLKVGGDDAADGAAAKPATQAGATTNDANDDQTSLKRLTDVGEMKRRTDAHSQELKNALKQTE
jgi:hypothetical protein